MFLRAEMGRARRLTCIVLTVILIFCLIPFKSFADTAIKCYSVEDGYYFEVDSKVTSSWEKHVNIELKVKNMGNQRIDNWHLTFETPYSIENLWNASILETDNNGTYTIRNNYYNQDIEVDSEVTIGMTLALGESEFGGLSSWYLLNTKIIAVDSDKYLVSYQEYSKWEGGYNGALILSSQEYVEDWSLTFDSEYEISSISNATIGVNEEGLYKVTNDGNTQNLSSNMLFLSIQGIPTENEFELRDVTMYFVGLAYTLTEDADDNGIADYQDFINLQEGVSLVTPTPSVEPTITPVPTVTEEPTEVPTEIPTVTQEPTVTDVPEYDGNLDADDDGLLNYEEDLYGTDRNDADSDDDLIDDFTEIRMGYDPNDSDSDKNGILDGEEDFDKDGITNVTEIEFGSCPYFPDTDFDDINDYDELHVYGTDPNKEDSNDDGILDGDALKLGLNPAVLDSDQDGILDKDEKTYQKTELHIAEDAELQGVSSVEVKGNFTNLLTSTTTIEDMYGKDVYSSQIDAIVGGLVSIETSSDFDTATIIFHYDENEIGVDEDDLCILWYDEASGEYVMLDEEQVLDKENNTVSYVTTHFSEYMLISKTTWIETWIESIQTLKQNRDSYLSGSKNAKYLVASKISIDDDEETYRYPMWNALYNLSSRFSESGMLGAIVYSGTTYYIYNQQPSQYLGWIMRYIYSINDFYYVSGDPDIGLVFPLASEYVRYFAEADDEVILYIFTNENNLNLDGYASEITNGGYHVIVVNMGDSDFVSSTTGVSVINYNSETFYEDSINEESKILGLVSDEDTSLDTDEDTLTDFEEITGHLLSNGTIVYTDSNTKYTDTDSLTDAEELGVRRSLKQSKIYSKISNLKVDGLDYWDYLSDPTRENSDIDAFLDHEDDIPRIGNDDIVYIFAIEEFWEDARYRQQLYLNADIGRVILIKISGNDFYDKWNMLGTARSVSGTIYSRVPHNDTDKYYFNIKAVVIITHGDKNNSIKIGRTWLTNSTNVSAYGDYNYNRMKSRKIDTLCLHACYSAKPNNNGELNMVEYFINYFPEINQVIGFDILLRSTSTNNYFGLWFDEYHHLNSVEYSSLFSHIFSENPDRFTIYFNVREEEQYIPLDYSAQGFVCYDQRGIVTNLFEDDVRNGILYYYTDSQGDSGRIVFGNDEFDYNVLHDPLLKCLQMEGN